MALITQIMWKGIIPMNDNLAHFLNMTYQERLELKKSNPSEYDQLAEAMRNRLNLKEPEAVAPKSKARFEKLTDAKTGKVRYIYYESWGNHHVWKNQKRNHPVCYDP